VELGPETTKWEVWGWYAFDWANSPFSNSFLGGLAAPIISGFATYNVDDDGKVHALFGIPVNPLSYYSTIVSISVICQIIMFILVGALADFGGMRKKMLIATTIVGSFAGMMFLAVPPEAYWLDGLAFVVANVAYGLGVVFYNSFLLLIVKNDPLVRNEKSVEKRFEVAQKLDNVRSGIGFAIGYIAGLIVLLINLVFLFLFPSCSPRCPHCLDKCYGYVAESRSSNRECLVVFNDTRPATVLNGTFSQTDLGNFTRAEFDQCRDKYVDMHSDNAEVFGEALRNTTATDVLAALLGEFQDQCADAALCENKFAVGTVDTDSLHNCVLELENGCDPNWWAIRTNIFLSCAWWLGFGLLAFKFILPRVSPPKPAGQSYVEAGLRKLRATLARAKRLPNTFRFLCAYWLFSDGMWTFAVGMFVPLTLLTLTLLCLHFWSTKKAAALFAIDTLGATAFELILLYLLTVITGGLGSYLLAKFHDKVKFTTLRGLIWSALIVVCLVTTYARIPGWLTTYAELYVLGGLYGMQMGSVQSFARVLLGRMTPKGHEAEFFAMYEVTNKGTAWLGPIAVAVVIEATNDVRWGVFTILPFIVVGGIILFWVDEAQGVQDAHNFLDDPDDDVAMEQSGESNDDWGSSGDSGDGEVDSPGDGEVASNSTAASAQSAEVSS
jgi:MFS-type transporter involved in bile tolerance (Atg22 family)